MSLTYKINVALREQNSQKIGSKRVKVIYKLFCKLVTLQLVLPEFYPELQWPLLGGVLQGGRMFLQSVEIYRL